MRAGLRPTPAPKGRALDYFRLGDQTNTRLPDLVVAGITVNQFATSGRVAKTQLIEARQPNRRIFVAVDFDDLRLKSIVIVSN